MLDPIVNFFTRIFQWIGRGIGFVVGIILWPFLWAGSWYTRRGWILKSVLGLGLAVLVGLYAYFCWTTQRWNGFDPDYVTAYNLDKRGASAGEAAPAAAGSVAKTCARSAIADVTADLVDFNVNRNAWVSSMILSKIGFFGIPWRHTPFFDNKAAFQLGINQALRRTTTELVDTLGRVRGTSQIDQSLQNARTSLAWDESAWYIGFRGPTRPTPSVYREAIADLRNFNDRLEACNATFDARADNLTTFLDRIAGDIGSTSDMLRVRSEEYNSGWFDTRADDRFWFAYGQLYAYYGIIHATHADFQDVIASRGLTPLWTRTEDQLRAALDITPFIISNGQEAGWIMPTHLATMGFYVLRVRSNLVELRSVLDR